MNCEYAYSLGSPGEGVHAARLGPFARNDVVMTVIAALLISVIGKYSFLSTLLVIVLLAIFLHWFFCVPTTLTVMLFGKK